MSNRPTMDSAGFWNLGGRLSHPTDYGYPDFSGRVEVPTVTSSGTSDPGPEPDPIRALRFKVDELNARIGALRQALETLRVWPVPSWANAATTAHKALDADDEAKPTPPPPLPPWGFFKDDWRDLQDSDGAYR